MFQSTGIPKVSVIHQCFNGKVVPKPQSWKKRNPEHKRFLESRSDVTFPLYQREPRPSGSRCHAREDDPTGESGTRSNKNSTSNSHHRCGDVTEEESRNLEKGVLQLIKSEQTTKLEKGRDARHTDGPCTKSGMTAFWLIW